MLRTEVPGLLRLIAIVILLAEPLRAQLPTAQPAGAVSRVWAPDLGDGRFKNPVLYADYSDPDVIRVGEDYYLVASSFDAVPGLPILHSRDLVNWEILGHVFAEQIPLDRYRTPQHGNGAWAPSIRYHNGKFYVFYPDPDFGIYMAKANSIRGPWSTPLLIKSAPGWIDPCPFWDDDGNAYLVNALAASRAGAKAIVLISRMSQDGTRLLDNGSILVDGHDLDPTLEGPKLYKREGYYYIFAPAGGVPTGWQVVFRSRSIYGPYERRVVLAQGKTAVNGPHQGAWVNTSTGENWFLHFQDQGAYGRVVWLEPMRWVNNWPVIGDHQDAHGVGEPVSLYRKPKVQHPSVQMTPADSDEFNALEIGPQWQWQVNPQPSWAFPSRSLGVLRLISVRPPDGEQNLWKIPNLLLQKLPGPEFTLTTKLTFNPRFPGDETGLVVMGQSYAFIAVGNDNSGLFVRVAQRKNAAADDPEVSTEKVRISSPTIWLRAQVRYGAVVRFSYSADGSGFHEYGPEFHAEPGRWIGAKVGIFAIGSSSTGELGYADYDWFRFDR